MDHTAAMSKLKTCVQIPPGKIGVASVAAYLQGKEALQIFDTMEESRLCAGDYYREAEPFAYFSFSWEQGELIFGYYCERFQLVENLSTKKIIEYHRVEPGSANVDPKKLAAELRDLMALLRSNAHKKVG